MFTITLVTYHYRSVLGAHYCGAVRNGIPDSVSSFSSVFLVKRDGHGIPHLSFCGVPGGGVTVTRVETERVESQ